MAISIPIFTTQLEKSREATDLANIRAAYAEAMSEAVGGNTTAGTYGNVVVATPSGATTYTVTTSKAQSTGTFEYADVSSVDWTTSLATLSVTKGSPFKVVVSISSAGVVTTTVSH